MEKKIPSLLKKLGKKLKLLEEKKTSVIITPYSQPHVLQYRMYEESLTHDERVMANLSPVRLDRNFGKMVLYFCPMQTLNITQRLNPGDGGNIPSEVVIEGLDVLESQKPGLYTLKDVIVHSNGTMSVTATSKTVWEPIN